MGNIQNNSPQNYKLLIPETKNGIGLFISLRDSVKGALFFIFLG